MKGGRKGWAGRAEAGRDKASARLTSTHIDISVEESVSEDDSSNSACVVGVDRVWSSQRWVGCVWV